MGFGPEKGQINSDWVCSNLNNKYLQPNVFIWEGLMGPAKHEKQFYPMDVVCLNLNQGGVFYGFLRHQLLGNESYMVVSLGRVNDLDIRHALWF
jgi:hypothetical protein